MRRPPISPGATRERRFGPVAILSAAVMATWVVAEAAEVGRRHVVLPADLPAPFATSSTSNAPRIVVRPPGASPVAPPGFAVTLFADGLSHARDLKVSAGGDVFVSESRAGRITLLRDADGDGRAEVRTTFLDGLSTPYGMAFHGGYFYVADTRRVWRVPYRPGDTQAGTAPTALTAEGAIGSGWGHSTRNIAIHPSGDRFYVAIGSAGNIAEEPEPRATIQEFRLDGPATEARGQRTFAGGLRNPVGIAFYPGTDRLFAVVNERDGLGDGLVPDYLTEVAAGGFYGWPYSYIGGLPQPGLAERRPDLVRSARLPDLLFRSHSAPIGMTFYTGRQFPEEYRGGAFVALRGSWNAHVPTGYQVAFVPFKDGRPAGGYITFLDGFRIDGREGEAVRAEVWGRPAGVAVAADGSLLVSDDTANTIWRVRWVGR